MTRTWVVLTDVTDHRGTICRVTVAARMPRAERGDLVGLWIGDSKPELRARAHHAPDPSHAPDATDVAGVTQVWSVVRVTPRTYGFADEHGNLIGYTQHADDDDARLAAQARADARGGAVEWWPDVRDDDGDLPPSRVAVPS